MDRSTRRLPDPTAGAPNGERRRGIRQKLHTPVYASFNGPQTGMVVDLSELIDLHEDGFAVQTSERLEVNRAVTLCLDLPETKSFIHGSGHVVWSDDAGRGGIQLSELPESSRKILKEWLFTNLLIACSNYAARSQQRARREDAEARVLVSSQVQESHTAVPIHDKSGILSRVETGLAPSLQVEAVRLEVAEIGGDVEAVLQRITERALSLTGASGAALAFLTDDKMICRARAGEPAPPLGAPLDVKQGLSGECVRSGLLVSCEDLENDSRVDPEVGRALGIGSLMAAPIVSDFRVVGLLEVFSPQPRAFAKPHETVLTRLVELIPNLHRDPTRREKMPPGDTQPETQIRSEALSGASRPPAESGEIQASAMEFDSIHAIREALWEQQPEGQRQVVSKGVLEPVDEQAPAAPSRLFYRALLWLVVAVVATVLGYLVGPIIAKRWADSAQASQRRPAAETLSGQNASHHNARAMSLEDLRKLADRGDADAQWEMAVRYHSGEGVPHDDVQAVQWYQRAAEQGNVAAQGALGAYYFAARGVPKDLSKAYFWSTIALAQGDEISKGRLELLASEMTPAQISAARQQAEDWIHQHSVAQLPRNLKRD